MEKLGAGAGLQENIENVWEIFQRLGGYNLIPPSRWSVVPALTCHRMDLISIRQTQSLRQTPYV